MQAVQIFTSLVLAAFAGYIGAWYFGAIEGNFALLLFLATVVTGAYWLAERFYFLPQRLRAAQAVEDVAAQRRAELDRMGIAKVDIDVQDSKERLLMQPWWLDWTAGLFPVIVVVFVLRSFLFEPFKIPSGSMIPTLEVGDLILVNKFHYGVRLPVLNRKVTTGETVKRGEVVVFRYPVDPRVDFIKRIVGLPGDEVSYLNAELRINGQAVSSAALDDAYDEESMRYMARFSEKLGEVEHRIQRFKQVLPFNPMQVRDFAGKDGCRHSVEGFVCKVPAGHYFVMGDNRDNSEDSRYWGFVPDENLVGRAFFVWMNFSNPRRIG